MSTDALPLNQLQPGTSAHIVDIQNNREIIRRLMSLGLSVGSEISLLHHRGHGVVVSSGGSRVALDQSIANHLLVKPLPDEAFAQPETTQFSPSSL